MNITDERRARQFLLALTHGIDPTTGGALPSSAVLVLQNAEIKCALLQGAFALEHMVDRARRRSRLPENVGRVWSAEEEEKLIAAFRSGESVEKLAAAHGRTVRAIETRLQRRGVLASEARTTRDRFAIPPAPPAQPLQRDSGSDRAPDMPAEDSQEAGSPDALTGTLGSS